LLRQIACFFHWKKCNANFPSTVSSPNFFFRAENFDRKTTLSLDLLMPNQQIILGNKNQKNQILLDKAESAGPGKDTTNNACIYCSKDTCSLLEAEWFAKQTATLELLLQFNGICKMQRI